MTFHLYEQLLWASGSFWSETAGLKLFTSDVFLFQLNSLSTRWTCLLHTRWTGLRTVQDQDGASRTTRNTSEVDTHRRQSPATDCWASWWEEWKITLPAHTHTHTHYHTRPLNKFIYVAHSSSTSSSHADFSSPSSPPPPSSLLLLQVTGDKYRQQ